MAKGVIRFLLDNEHIADKVLNEKELSESEKREIEKIDKLGNFKVIYS